MHDNTTTVPRYVEEERKKKKKKKKKTRRTSGVEFYLRPCTSRASDSCLRLRGRGLERRRRRRTKNASEEKEGGLLRGDGVNEEEDAKGGSIQRILAPPRPPEPASPRPNYRAHRSHHLVHARNLHPTSISFVVVELNVSCEIVEGN